MELVIHYGSPRQVTKLIQRIGRSRHSRRSSAKGLIVTNTAQMMSLKLKQYLRRIKEDSIEEQKIQDGSLDVLAHHLVGLTIQLGIVSCRKCF